MDMGETKDKQTKMEPSSQVAVKKKKKKGTLREKQTEKKMLLWCDRRVSKE